MILYYLRHGDPIYDPDSLTEYGHVQADALSKRLKYSGLDYLFSSPSNRARLTADPTAKALNLPVEIEDFLSEDITWGEFTLPLDGGKSRAWIFQIKELVKLQKFRYNHTILVGVKPNYGHTGGIHFKPRKIGVWNI